MPNIPSDTWYSNLNQCFNVKWNLTGVSTYSQCVSSVKAGEIVILNNSGGDVTVKTGRMPGLSAQSLDPTLVTEFLLKDGDEFTFRGITDTHQVSAAGASGTLFGRSQWYSMTPQTAR